MVTFRGLGQAYAAIDDIAGMEVPELADVPLESELATGGPNREQAQQAPIRACDACASNLVCLS